MSRICQIQVVLDPVQRIDCQKKKKNEKAANSTKWSFVVGMVQEGMLESACGSVKEDTK